MTWTKMKTINNETLLGHPPYNICLDEWEAQFNSQQLDTDQSYPVNALNESEEEDSESSDQFWDEKPT